MPTLTGTLVLPDESDVRAGVNYGADGTEYTGTMEPASTGSGALPIDLTAVGMAKILPLIQARLRWVTGLPAERIILWLGDQEPPHLQADQDLVLRLQGFTPDQPWFIGAGRAGPRLLERLEVQMRTRLALDPSGESWVWYLDAVNGHLLLRFAVLQAMVGFHPLDPVTGASLVTSAISCVPSRPPRADEDRKKSQEWGSEKLTFEIGYIQPLDTQLDISATEDA